MSLLSWSDKFLIDVEIIDGQHKNLFELISNIYKAVESGAEKVKIVEGLDALFNYTQYHFSQEEELMQSIGYVRYDQHKIEHNYIAGKVAEFKKKLPAGEAKPDEFLKFLYTWLTRHIMEQDKKIGKFIEKNALKPVDL